MGRWTSNGSGRLISLLGGDLLKDSSDPEDTFGKSYRQLDDSPFVFCHNCGHSIKAEDIRKMTTPQSNTPRFLPAYPGGFLTWSTGAANRKFEKLRQHLMSNMTRLRSTRPDQTRRRSNTRNKDIQIKIAESLKDPEEKSTSSTQALAIVGSRGRSRAPLQGLAFDLDDLESEGIELRTIGSRGQSLESFSEEEGDLSGGTRSTLPIGSFESSSSSSSSSAAPSPSTQENRSARWGRFALSSTEVSDVSAKLDPSQDPIQTIPRPLACSTPVLSSTKGQLQVISALTLAKSSPLDDVTGEEAELKRAPWFQAGIPREIALEVLRNETVGSFIVRESTTRAGCFALSLRVPPEFLPSGIAHYLIQRATRGYKIKGFTKEFSSLTALITHHSVMPELLPCTLALAKYLPPKPTRKAGTLARNPPKRWPLCGEPDDLDGGDEDFVEPEKLSMYRQLSTDF